MAGIERFAAIKAWQIARRLTAEMYALMCRETFSRDFALIDQTRRAAGSVMHNIAEGFDAGTDADFTRFLIYARRSATEVQSQLYIALDQGYLSQAEFDHLYDLAGQARKAIHGFIRYLLFVIFYSLSEERPGSVVRSPDSGLTTPDSGRSTMDYLPLSYLNQFAYCPRRFWYMYVQGEMVENVHVLRGVLNHERAHTPGYETIPSGVTVHRRVYVYSHTLAITGYTDLLEEHVDGRLVPVEYKQGRQGQWSNDEAQLCAQALCLEEMTGKAIEQGALFYFGSRRRVAVDFTPALRTTTRHLVQQIQRTLANAVIPAHTEQRQRCNGCSLYEVCLPTESRVLSA